jgi:hypothetical protein
MSKASQRRLMKSLLIDSIPGWGRSTVFPYAMSTLVA